MKRRTTTNAKRKYTPDDAVALFLLDCEARRLAPSTVVWYRSKLTRFASWLAAQHIGTIDAVDALAMRRYLATLTDTTIQHQHNCGRTLRRFFRFLVDEGVIDQPPNVAQPKLPRVVLPALTEAQVKTVLRACDERYRAIVLTILDSGVRASELAALRVEDVDLATGAVAVRKGKGSKTRITFIGARTRKAITHYLSDRQPRPHEPLFPSKATGLALTLSGIVQIMRRLRDASGVDVLTAHALRRTFAITALRGGMDIHVLARLMGHADTQVLWRYLDILEDDLREAHASARPVDRLK